ncbi:cathepsin M-like, partial [Armigeres subalbatus]|uniref:cathepsin M-like n=1 Tax=Armigeres subalbatus TaxID=124917 RepID=UPI002ED2896E
LKYLKLIFQQGTCGFNADLAICNISDWGILPKKEDALAFALWKVGPLAVSLNAAPSSFQLYQSGIYDSTDCTSATLNHAMLLVGYTPTYWIIKNWWSKTWGENGYMRMVRGKNMCGISNYAAYCTIK